MPAIHIIMPQLGESIAEASIINFLVKPGDIVEAGQDLIEVETNKANMNVTSPCRGRVAKITAQLNESYTVGAVLGQIEATKEEAVRLGLDIPAPAKAAAVRSEARFPRFFQGAFSRPAISLSAPERHRRSVPKCRATILAR